MPAIKRDSPNFPREGLMASLPPSGAQKAREVKPLTPVEQFVAWITEAAATTEDPKVGATLTRIQKRVLKAGAYEEADVQAVYAALGQTLESPGVEAPEPEADPHTPPVQVQVRAPASSPAANAEDMDGLVRLSAQTAIGLLAEKIVEEVWRTQKKALVKMVTGEEMQRALAEELKRRLKKGFEDNS